MISTITYNTMTALLFKSLTTKTSKLLSGNLKKTVANATKYSTDQMQEQKVIVGGQTINFVKFGLGDRTVVCFPGALGTIWSDFGPQITGLDRTKFTIIGWDPPGYGHSRPPGRNFGPKFYEDDADVAHAFLTQLGVRKFSLLGWSDGGISSMIVAAKYPEAVEKLVVWGANSYVLPEEIQTYENIRDVKNWSEKMRAPLVELYTERGLQDLWNGWCDALSEISSKGGDICKDRLKDVRCPTLIVHGDKDPMVAAEHPEYLKSHIKGSTLHRFPEGKHNVHLRYSDEFNKLVSNFLSG